MNPELFDTRKYSACLACGRGPSDAHRLKFAQARALGRKVSDEFAVPLPNLPPSPRLCANPESVPQMKSGPQKAPIHFKTWQRIRPDGGS